MSDSLWLYSSWNSPGQNIGVGSHFPLQGIFPTQEWNPGLRHCGQILYQLSYQGSPRILEWVAYPFSSGSSWPRNWTRSWWLRDRLPTPVYLGFPCGSAGKESTCNVGDLGLLPGLGRSPGDGIAYPLLYTWASLVAQLVKNLPGVQETPVWFLGWEDPLEKG